MLKCDIPDNMASTVEWCRPLCDPEKKTLTKY